MYYLLLAEDHSYKDIKIFFFFCLAEKFMIIFKTYVFLIHWLSNTLYQPINK